MGRAIVRSPKVFLMDEPLSNLDAKLRVQMRTEVSRIQQRVGTTTVYVTHDQVEAMTLGDRVAVMRGGVIQQVDSPKNLYEKPQNLFVAGFIGSPSMNFLPAKLEGDMIKLPFGDTPIPAAVRGRLTGDGKPRDVIAGVRPEHFEDAQVEPDKPGLRFTAPVSVVESMGSELYAYFDVQSSGVESAELVELAEDSGISDLPRHGDEEQQVVARLDAASRARPGEQAQLVLDTDHLMLFDPEGGKSLLSDQTAAAA
jgi:multiple sugar transport system ATP-binding protein